MLYHKKIDLTTFAGNEAIFYEAFLIRQLCTRRDA